MIRRACTLEIGDEVWAFGAWRTVVDLDSLGPHIILDFGGDYPHRLNHWDKVHSAT